MLLFPGMLKSPPSLIVSGITLCAALGVAMPLAAQQGITEIVVTAQKREQNIQDIPLAVTALSGAHILEHGITDLFDLQETAPGLFVDQSQTATTANFSIRGIGTSSQNFGLESSVGLYIDGVFRARQSALINELVDIERVEVLRGPQGTLFGRNSSAGAVLLNTVAPSHEADGFFELSYGNLDLFTASGAFGGSLVEDVLAARVVGFTSARDGFIDVLGMGDNLITDRNRHGGRIQLLYTPNEDVSLRVMADYSEIDEVCCYAGTVRNNFFSFDGTPGTDALVASLGIPVVTGDRFYDDLVGMNRLPESGNEDKGASAELNWDTPGGTFTSITAARSFNTNDDIDADFSGMDGFYRISSAEADTFSQEIRFTGSADRLNYLAGAYYFTQDLDSDKSTVIGADFNSLFSAFIPSEVGAIVDGVNALSMATGGLVPMVAPAIPVNSTARDLMEQEHEAWALFGQVDFSLTEQWRISAGLRYTEEDKDLLGAFTQDQTLLIPDFAAIGQNLALVGQGLAAPDLATLTPLLTPGWGLFLLGGIAPDFAPRPPVDTTLNDDQITWNLKLSWLPTQELMFYFGYATGFKSGGTNTDRIPVAANQLFGAEKSDSWEGGVKASWPAYNLRASLSVHHTLIEDYQSVGFTGNAFALQNAGELESTGGELEVAWAPMPALLLSGAYIYMDVEYNNFERGSCWVVTPFQTGQEDPGRAGPQDLSCDRSGDRVASSPRHTVMVSATRTYSLSDTLSGHVHADFNYRSSMMTDRDADPLKLQDGFGLLNLRAGLSLKPVDLDLTLWVRNVLDEDYHGAMFATPLQDGKLSAYPREPRTYGVTLRKQF